VDSILDRVRAVPADPSEQTASLLDRVRAVPAGSFDSDAQALQEVDSDRGAFYEGLFRTVGHVDREKALADLGNKIAQNTGIDPDRTTLSENYEELERTWKAANFNGSFWAKHNPILARLVDEKPKIARLVVGNGLLEAKVAALNPDLVKYDPVLKEARGGILGGRWKALADADKHTLVNKLSFALMMQRRFGENMPLETSLLDGDTVYEDAREALGYGDGGAGEVGIKELEQIIGQMRAAFPQRDYSTGPGTWAIDSALQSAPYMWDVTKATVAGAGIGLLAGNPMAGAKWGGGIATGRLESGSLYLELMDAGIEEPVAAGYSIAYGIVAGYIEQWGMEALAGAAGGKILGAIPKGGKAAVLKAIAEGKVSRKAVQMLGKAMRVAVPEMNEEGVQSLGKDAATWGAEGRDAGDFERPHPIDAVGRAASAWIASAPAALGFGGAAGLVGMGTQKAGEIAYKGDLGRMLRDDMMRNETGKAAAGQMNAVDAMLKDALGEVDPDEAARIVLAKTAEQGRPVTHAYVDPDVLVEKFEQSGPQGRSQLTEIVGADVEYEIRSAMMAGTKVAIPLAKYAGILKSDVGSKISPFFTQTENVASRAETEEMGARITKLSEQFEKEAEEAEKAEAAGKAATGDASPAPNEHAFMSKLRGELKIASRMTALERRQAVAIWRARGYAIAEQRGWNTEQVFGWLSHTLSVEKSDGRPGDATEAQGPRLEQAAVPDDFLAARLADLPPERLAKLDTLAPGLAEHLRVTRLVADLAAKGEAATEIEKADLAELRAAAGQYAEAGLPLAFGFPTALRTPEAATGRDLHAALARAMGGSGIAAEALGSAGVPVLRTTFNEETQGKVRGWIERTNDRLRIVLTPDADHSTFLHETGHAFMAMLGDLADAADAPQKVKDDFDAILKWTGYGDRATQTAMNVELAALQAVADPTAAQKKRMAELAAPAEKWARGFEAYLMDGTAPSKRLREAFKHFRAWLINVYVSQRELGVELSPEIRGVMDRLLATDREIAAVSSQPFMRPIFDLAGVSRDGIDDKDLEDLLDAFANAKDNSYVFATGKVLREHLRQREAWWKREAADIESEAMAEWEKLPGRRAQMALKGEPRDDVDTRLLDVKLDRKKVEALLPNKDDRAGLGKRLGIRNAMDPDAFADLLGFKSAAAMFAAVKALPSKEKFAAERTDAEMTRRNPGYLEETGRLRNLVKKGVLSDPRERAILKELALLHTKAGVPFKGVPEEVRSAAQGILAKKTIGQMNPNRMLDAERRHAEAAYRAALQNKWDEVVQHKRLQAIAFMVGKGMQERLDATGALGRSILARNNATNRSRLGKAGTLGLSEEQMQAGATSPTLALHDALVQVTGLAARSQKKRLNGYSASAAATALAESEALLAADNVGLPQAQMLHDLLIDARGWKDLTTDEAEAVANAIATLDEHGKRVVGAAKAGAKAEFEQNVSDVLDDLAERPDYGKHKSDDGIATTTLQKFLEWDNELTEPEELSASLGPTFRRLFHDRWMQRKHFEKKLADDVLDPFLATLVKHDKKLRDLLDKEVDGAAALLPWPRDIDIEGPITFRHLFMITLNMGTSGEQGNRVRLLRGYGWKEANVLKVINDNATPEFVDAINAAFRVFDGRLKTEMVAKETRKHGYAPKLLGAIEIQTKSGVITGGYYPMKYDERLRKNHNFARDNMMVPDFYGVGTNKGYTQQRARNYSDVVDLRWATMLPNVQVHIHDIAFDEFVHDTNRLFNDERIKVAFNHRLGQSGHQEMQYLLEFIANEKQHDAEALHTRTARMMSFMRSRFVVAQLGLAANIAMADVLNLPGAAARGFDNGGVDKAASLMAALQCNPLNPSKLKAMRAAAEAKSEALKIRAKAFSDEDRTSTIQSFRKRRRAWSPLFDHAANFAWYFQNATDKWASTQLWWAGYWSAQKRGMSEAECVREADSRVSRNLPGHERSEQSRVHRDRVWANAIVFYGFVSKMRQQVGSSGSSAITSGFQAARGQNTYGNFALTTAKAAASIAAISVIQNMIGEWITGRGPDDDEEWSTYALKKSVSFPIMLSHPVFGSVLAFTAESAISGSNKFSNRSMPAIGVTLDIIKYAKSITDEDVDTPEKLENVLSIAAIMAKLPVRQPRRTFDYLKGVATDEWDVEDPFDFADGMIYGPHDEGGKPGNPAQDISQLVQGD
jgi:hypothetical protein